MKEFYEAGGWGMHPVSILGFALIIVAFLHALKPNQRYAHLAVVLGIATLVSGGLGTATGICASAHFIQKVEQAKQLEIFLMGLEESLHDAILSMVLAMIGALLGLVGIFRGGKVPA